MKKDDSIPWRPLLAIVLVLGGFVCVGLSINGNETRGFLLLLGLLQWAGVAYIFAAAILRPNKRVPERGRYSFMALEPDEASTFLRSLVALFPGCDTADVDFLHASDAPSEVEKTAATIEARQTELLPSVPGGLTVLKLKDDERREAFFTFAPYSMEVYLSGADGADEAAPFLMTYDGFSGGYVYMSEAHEHRLRSAESPEAKFLRDRLRPDPQR